MNKYLSNVYDNLKIKYYYQTEFLDSVYQLFESINDFVSNDPNIEKLGIVERLVEPDRVISFKVPWVDDKGNVIVNTGYRVQFNNLIGPYKGGIRFHPTVNESILKFLALEQTLKNALTGLPMGGAKGGSDFDPTKYNTNEIMRFTQSFMLELYKYIGPNIDVPAGDIGVNQLMIGYMFNTYKRITNTHVGVLTGKHVSYGGSLVRPESTGYGVCYITDMALNTYFNDSLKDKTVIISGSGQVGINVAKKAIELGANVIGLSSITGVLYDPNGLDVELVSNIQVNNSSFKDYLTTYPNTAYYSDVKSLWNIKADIAIPCATENELDTNDVQLLINNSVKMIVEGANKPTTKEAIDLLIANNVIIIPSKAANAGGVATSGLEMNQNASHSKWSFEEVDNKLKDIMTNIFVELNEFALIHNITLIEAANIVSFNKIYEAYKYLGV